MNCSPVRSLVNKQDRKIENVPDVFFFTTILPSRQVVTPPFTQGRLFEAFVRFVAVEFVQVVRRRE